jgi:DNA-binding transcriptional LysR family regulator
MFELRDLWHLLNLDEHRHFGRAADAVGISQPALTKSLQRLEQELGVRLFDRSRGRVTPTKVGEEVISRARHLMTDALEMKRTVDLLRGVETGCVSVGVGPAMSESYITAAFASIAQEHPGTQVSIRIDHWQQLTEWLLAGELDFYVADITEAESDHRLYCTRLPAQEFVWFCRAAHPLANNEEVSRTDILEFPIATPKMPIWTKDWFLAAADGGRQATLPRAFPSIECENYSMLKRIVLSCDCVSAALKGTVEDEIEDRSIVILQLDAPTLTTHAGIVRLPNRTLSPLAVALAARIEELSKESESH